MTISQMIASGVLRRVLTSSSRTSHQTIARTLSTRISTPTTSSAFAARSTSPPSTKRWHGGPAIGDDAPTVSVTFVQPDDTQRVVQARVGESLLQVAHRHDIDLEGACEGVCACSTCHLILEPDLFDSLEEASEDEEDMLDMAFGLTETSRLGCQITVREDMEGAVLEMPKATRNFYVDGHVPKPH
mmetsp:Transcript_265/g.733  ORF Transcript_265/g.733 Transcript_265/m.733 type:complete len:186 (-) Transcript_265:1226-1783(-)|eukprot:CAMPEP_0198113064 /NCGR_PEP_ID=MMETSP1442-20131203/4818_1 /TAXON_ID= /ORGANISM="Craspedostauros australis, Strain CCMP3328" /LENGTH=185 /DNA_ID=CAMNT_0043770053 /DNA_START=190 /DNA_END=747 /DNA_ORIENTATION=-